MKICCFLYHRVTDDSQSAYTHTQDIFDQHIKKIVDTGLPVLGINELEHSLVRQAVLISTDDGYASDLHVADRLERYNLRGHFFITTSTVKKFGFLTVQDVKELYSRGHIIGSHSHTHTTPFTRLSYEQMREEWSASLSLLQSWLETEIKIASIPGGSINNIVERSAYEQGITHLFTSEPTPDPWYYKNMMCIGRVCPKPKTSLEKIEQLAQLKGFKVEQAKRNIKLLIKKLIGRIK